MINIASEKPNPKFHAQHFNALAKDLRELYEEVTGEESPITFIARRTLEEVALRFAHRFYNERIGYEGYAFDPIKFLNACSPNPELYDFGELWEGKTNGE